MTARRRKNKLLARIRLFLGALLLIGLLSAIWIGWDFYQRLYAPSVRAPNDNFLYIPTGSNYLDLLALLQEQQWVENIEHFDWVARKMNLPNHIHPGRYRVHRGMSNHQLVTLLRSGQQEPLRLVLNNFRTVADLASYVSRRLEADSASIHKLLTNPAFLQDFGLEPPTALCLVIPNTYYFYWNTSASQFVERMHREFQAFWTDQRQQQAQALGLSPVEVIILASIVEEETNHAPEMSTIASVYLNRLRKGMKLQADPTVKYALGDFSLQRILKRHLDHPSPYNTYVVAGLPPGPICTPSPVAIDATLQAPQTNYLYFCANPNQPGTHVFAATYAEHKRNARRYHQWLNSQMRS